MRVDQLLWHLRYYKSRSLATTACKKGHVKVNEQIVKPSKEIIATDTVKVRKNQLTYKFKILDVPKKRVNAKLVNIFRDDQTIDDQLNSKEFIKLNKISKRIKGKGRPTKKERRKLDNLNKWFIVKFMIKWTKKRF